MYYKRRAALMRRARRLQQQMLDVGKCLPENFAENYLTMDDAEIINFLKQSINKVEIGKRGIIDFKREITRDRQRYGRYGRGEDSEM